jgi:hypothetical protein
MRAFTRLTAVVPVVVLSALAGAQLVALRAAGLNGTAPPHAAQVKALISTLTDNWVWLIATGIGLVLVLIAGLMTFGSQRAPDHLFRVIGGVMLILIVVPAVLA